eukprot:TRINITY_DN266819_c0_g1_i1.p1 TRINITY_DN266819_c0_g1~~TRINITY_DN266819_c0_g1_i1.p1  ORF type:complete len:507 (-),score=120.03 TRINITY_DN266819_c0_g1_i1:151-1671(-)
MLVLGVMTGTSVDGIDLAFCSITSKSSVVLEKFFSLPFPEIMRDRVFEIMHNPENVTLDKVGQLSSDLGEMYAKAMNQVIEEFGQKPDFIANHGQTVWHHPPFTSIQLGDPSVIAALTGITTIGDFRTADLALGGQGAPITSTFDTLVLGSESAWRIIQNIGGISNCTIIAPKSRTEEEDVSPIAFDCGPGNVFMDFAASNYDCSIRYDHNGDIARSGTINESFRDEIINSFPYFKQSPPKTTGRELFTLERFENIKKIAIERGISNCTIIAPKSRTEEEDVSPIAFDCGPGNVFMDFAASNYDCSIRYDHNGDIARSGTINESFRDEIINSFPYFKQSPPKTTGRELFTLERFENIKKIAIERGISPKDLLSSITDLTAKTIVDSYQFSPELISSIQHSNAPQIIEIIVGGGGTRNDFLLERIEFHAKKLFCCVGESEEKYNVEIKVMKHEDVGIDSDAKEAMAFALLGYLAVKGLAGNVPSCTHASGPVVLGKICPAVGFCSSH